MTPDRSATDRIRFSAADPEPPPRKRRVPLYVVGAAAATGVFALVQAAFWLLSQHNDFLFALGLLCLLAAPYAAYRAGLHIARNLPK